MSIPCEYSNEDDDDTQSFLDFETKLLHLNMHEDHAQRVTVTMPHDMNLKKVCPKKLK